MVQIFSNDQFIMVNFFKYLDGLRDQAEGHANSFHDNPDVLRHISERKNQHSDGGDPDGRASRVG